MTDFHHTSSPSFNDMMASSVVTISRTPPNFESLSPELRNTLYHAVLLNDGPIIVGAYWSNVPGIGLIELTPRGRVAGNAMPNILLASRLVYNEASAVFHGGNTFDISQCPVNFLTHIGQSTKLLRNISVGRVSAYDLRLIFERLTLDSRLESITIEINSIKPEDLVRAMLDWMVKTTDGPSRALSKTKPVDVLHFVTTTYRPDSYHLQALSRRPFLRSQGQERS